MFTKRIPLILYILVFSLGLNAQSIVTKKDPLLAFEKQFLDLVTKDTVNNMHVVLPLLEFTLGLPKNGFNGIAFIKRKQKITIQQLGTGRVYEITKGKNNQYEFLRLDSTLHSGVNFNSFTFFMSDSLYQVGGTGFWKIRDFITYFSKKTKQWELEMSNKVLPIFNSIETAVLIKTNEVTRKLYISNAARYTDFPNSLATYFIDSCYEYNFNSREWKTLGAINPNLKKSLTNAIDLNYSNDNFNIFTRQLDFYWINFSTNTYGKLKDAKNSEIKQEWTSLYPASEKVKDLQFTMGDSLYLIKISGDQKFEYRAIALTIADFDLTKTDYIYLNNRFSLGAVVYFTKQYGVYLLLLVLIGISLIMITIKDRIKKTRPIDLMDILYNNFYNSLSVIEKELIKVLFEYQQKGTELNTKIINKIIGVQQKDTLTQNKSRSDHFIKINQKFSLATQHKMPLIKKNRDAQDKRQFNYTLNLEYIVEIEQLLKTK